MVPEIWSVTERIFCHYGPFFALLPPLWTQKIKILKKWKNTWRYHFINVYHKWQSYDVWFFRYGVQQTKVFCHFGLFFVLLLPPLPPHPTPPLTTQKIKILQNWKMPLELSSFYQKCTKNHDHILYCSLDMARNRFNCYFSFWAIF